MKKKSGFFDVTKGAYDGAEECELYFEIDTR